MPRSLFLSTALCVGCQGPAAFDPGTDTDPVSGSDTDVASGCDATLAVSFADAPSGPLPTDTIPIGSTWTTGGVRFTTSGYSGGVYRMERDDQGCLILGAGTLSMDLLGTGCAGAAARITVTDRCSAACTEMRVLAGEEVTALTRNEVSDVERTYLIAPREPFGSVEVGSLHAALCAVEVDRTTIPDSLVPEDSGAPF